MQNILDRYHFKLRRCQESDLDKIERLLKTHYEEAYVPKRRLIFDWVATHNPTSDKGTSYLVIEDNAKIIAYLGRMPVDFMITGEKQKGYFLHDLLTDPEYRRKGLGLLLSNRLFVTWENETDTFVVSMWMNKYSHSILKRRTYYELNAHSLVRPINLDHILMRVIKNRFVVRLIAPFGYCFISLYDRIIANRHYPEISISQIEKFDQRFDDFAERVSKKFPVIKLRHCKYLNWKYVEKPFSNYTIFTAERNGKLTGYIILALKSDQDINIGVVVDILADPDDSPTIGSLCQVAIEFFKKENIDRIRCVLTNKNFIRIFKKNLFFENNGSPVPVMLGNLNKYHAREIITNIDNWFLTFGDSDSIVWDKIRLDPTG